MQEWRVNEQKITLLQLKLPLEMVKGFFIPNVLQLTAKKCTYIFVSIKYPIKDKFCPIYW